MTFDHLLDKKINFEKAIVYSINPIALDRIFRDGSGGRGKYAPERQFVELFDSEGNMSSLPVSIFFQTNILPYILNGETRSIRDWYEMLYWKYRNSGFQSNEIVAVGMFQLMALDLISKQIKLPLHRALGADKDYALAYKGGGSITLEDYELLADMKRYVEEGYKCIKFKVGSDRGKDIARDIRRIKLIRDNVGDDVEIAVDANQVFSEREAIEFSSKIEEFNIAWLEEPIHSQNMNGIKNVCMHSNIPIAYGESMRNYYAYETYVEKGVKHLQPSFGRMSNILDLFRIRDFAHANGVRFSSGGRAPILAQLACMFEGDERMEYHEPISLPVSRYMIDKPIEKNAAFHMNPDIYGIQAKFSVDKLIEDKLLKNIQYFYH